MLPTFPEMAPLRLEHKDAIDAIARAHDPYSDFNVISLYCWDKGDIAVSSLNGNMVVLFNDYIDPSKHFLSFLGLNDVGNTAAVLLSYAEERWGIAKLALVPAMTAQHLKEAGFEIFADEDHHDYIYDVVAHVAMEGSQFKKRRNLLKKFKKQEGAQAAVRFEQELSRADWQDMCGLVKRWAEQKKEHHAYSKEEYEAFVRLRDCHHLSDFFYFFVEIGDEVVGINVSEVIDEAYVLSHFEKIDPQYPGLGEFAMHEMCTILNQYGYRYINFMQDLGIEGMKQNKRLRRPVHMLEKYVVTRKPGVLYS